MTPFVALFVAMDGTPRQNEWFYKPARTYWGTKRAEWLASVQLAGTVGGHAERVKTVIVPVFRRKILLIFRPCFLPVHPILELKLRGQCDKQMSSSLMPGRVGLALSHTAGAPLPKSPQCGTKRTDRSNIHGYRMLDSLGNAKSGMVCGPCLLPLRQTLTSVRRNLNRHSRTASRQRCGVPPSSFQPIKRSCGTQEHHQGDNPTLRSRNRRNADPEAR